MPSLIVLFNLKKDSDKEAYEKWAAETDVPTVKSLKSVDGFKVYRNLSVLGNEKGSLPYQYIEVIEINDMDGLIKDITSELMQKVASEFQTFADNPIFIVSQQFA
ncbi:MAG TPA: hypothetical protein PKC30_16835 [Saprospiraceae bacterium]|nr:hypothetical protein [Saprospiraceae bacterium]